MAFRLVSSGGSTNDPVVLNLPVSGVVAPGLPAVIARAGTGGAALEGGAGVDTTRTALFGVFMDYRQGASDTFARVVPFNDNQIWEVDCANAVTTAQIGIGQYLSATRGYVHNQETHVEAINRVFFPTAITGATTGSGKLLGFFTVIPGGFHGT
jgi:hypothetical protein